LSFSMCEAHDFSNFKGKVRRANIFLIKFIPTLSLQFLF
jgi:hypothetical protein